MLRRALEADTRGPKEGEPEATRPGNQSPPGIPRKRRRQRRKAHRERKAQAGEGLGLIPDAGPNAEGTLKAHASARGGNGAQGEPATPKPEGVSLLADKRRDQDPNIKELPRTGRPPGHGPPRRLRPRRKTLGGTPAMALESMGMVEPGSPGIPGEGKESAHPGQHGGRRTGP